MGSRVDGHADERFGVTLPVLDFIGEHRVREREHLRENLVAALAVDMHASKLGNAGDRAAIRLAIELHSELHGRILARFFWRGDTAPRFAVARRAQTGGYPFYPSTSATRICTSSNAVRAITSPTRTTRALA